MRPILSSLPKPSYFVLNGHTLGYVNIDRAPAQFNVLQGSVLLGGHDWKNGPVAITRRDVLVPATIADFERFRVSHKGHLDPEGDHVPQSAAA